MSIGIGLGGFMQGFQQSQKMRMAEEQDEKRTAMLDRQMERQDKQDARQDVLNSRADAEYERSETQRQTVASIGANAQKEFDTRVASGTAKPGDFDSFWSSYALPKLKNTYLANGDLNSAREVMKWGESVEAKEGAKLAMGALIKAQTGDPDGALADVIKAGSLKGYIDHGYEVQGHDKIMTPDGALAGYRLRLKTPDGKDVEQDVQLNDLPRLVSTFLNPEAAWQSQLAARAKATEKADELKTYEQKKQIDKKYGTGENKQRGDAITALRKRLDGGLAGEEKKFDDLPREEQEKLIGAELELQGSQPGIGAQAPAAPAAGSGRKVVVDTATGKPVAQQPAAPAQRPAAAAPAPSPAEVVAAADQAVRQGQSPVRIAEELTARGVPEEQWPDSLKSVISAARQDAIGLGR
ncbi:hypothetical protein J2T08_003600 [Neorhizobium galegae]|uniref:hypothetical protein n=1 Tax=Neorhizobium galegae TaxID=399 RepID=UPI0027857554|nr:hypothetical protein [Neorhizobium galegae]MDQ0135679.1 hypothetical protein [Neorhizobium galegae]